MNKLLQSLLITALTLPCAALAQDASKITFGFGVEGFNDRYNEPDLDVKIDGNHGSLTGYFNYDAGSFFNATDGRVSYGTTDYESPSGTLSGVAEWEFELRNRTGVTIPMWGGSLSPYAGLGVRHYIDEGKNRYTSTFAFGYDRRILQVYLPVGVSYTYTTSAGWTITPMIEYDQLLYGNVNSRLGTVSGYPNLSNKQTDGYGIRGELMFGGTAKSYSWQVGPFVRYWNIEDSDLDCVAGGCGYEPQNDRTQIGLAARFLW